MTSLHNLERLRQAKEHYEKEEIDAAIMLLELSVKEDPEFVDALHLLGLAEQSQGNLKKAIQWLGCAIEVDPDAFVLRNTLGNILTDKGDILGALDEFEYSTNLNPEYSEGWYNRGVILLRTHEYLLAHESFMEALKLSPEHNDALINDGLALKDLDRLEEAKQQLEYALLLKKTTKGYNNLGIVYREMGDEVKALECYEQCILLDQDSAGAHNNAGLSMMELGQTEAALAHFKHAVRISSGDPVAHLNMAFCYIDLQQFDRAWEAYRARKLVNMLPKYTGRPEWEGEPLQGETVLLIAEQGLGDEIEFASCIPDLPAETGRFIVQCDPRLKAIYQRSFPMIKVKGVERKDQNGCINRSWIESLGDVAFENAMGDLLRFYRHSLEDFPIRDGYLEADPDKVLYWKERLDELGSGLKVGICWRSGMQKGVRKHYVGTTSDLSKWHQLLKVRGVQFVLLQYDDVVEELKEVKRATGVTIHQLPGLDLKNDQDDLAALMVALNLTISIGTAVMQLAAAVKGSNVWGVGMQTERFQHRLLRPLGVSGGQVLLHNQLHKLVPEQMQTAECLLQHAVESDRPAEFIDQITNRWSLDQRIMCPGS